MAKSNDIWVLYAVMLLLLCSAAHCQNTSPATGGVAFCDRESLTKFLHYFLNVRSGLCLAGRSPCNHGKMWSHLMVHACGTKHYNLLIASPLDPDTATSTCHACAAPAYGDAVVTAACAMRSEKRQAMPFMRRRLPGSPLPRQPVRSAHVRRPPECVLRPVLLPGEQQFIHKARERCLHSALCAAFLDSKSWLALDTSVHRQSYMPAQAPSCCRSHHQPRVLV